MNSPFDILRQVMPRSRSVEELVANAAQLGPPPDAGFRVSPMQPGNPAPGAGARLQGMPQSPLVAGGGLPSIQPPMTQGETRTSPRIGEHLLGRM